MYYMYLYNRDTVEPLIKNPPRKGHLYTKDTISPTMYFRMKLIHFQLPKKRTTSLQVTKWLAPKCPLLRDSTDCSIITKSCQS